MSHVELASEVGDDFEQILEHLERHEVEDAAAPLEDISQAFNVLETNPHIGHPVADDLRELTIGRHFRGYVALYRYVPEVDTVFVLALRGEREAGYKRD